MRALALIACVFALPAFADQIAATSRITAVTVFPQGAEVTREVRFNAPAGAHDLRVTDLPQATVPELIRLAPGAGLQLGAFALRTDRLAPRDDLTSPDLQAAQAEVASWETRERAALAAIEAIEITAQAAEAQASFLTGTRAEGAALTPEALKALAATIGTEVLAAKQAAMAARAALPDAQKALDDAQKGLEKAREVEAAVLTGAEDYATLTVAVTTPAAGEQTLTITHFVEDATWQPVYDLLLTRADTPALALKRGVLVSQSSGEDWQDVALTLSTAQPSAQAEPSALWPELRSIVDPAKEAEAYARAVSDEAGMAEPVMAPAMVEAAAMLEGDTVVYAYPQAVDVASGVENLRLALDEKSFAPKVYALAVPRLDRTAFVMARFANESPETLLPGQAFLMREGVLVGSTYLDVLAPGAEVELAFGAIEGLRLKRDMPKRAEGDRGILSGSTQREETAVLEVENLTNELWPVRLLDLVPYTEQEDLEIGFDATPPPVQTDVDGGRGILAWEFDIAPGETKAVTLTHTLRWPAGMELR